MEVVLLHGVEYDVSAPVAVEDLVKSLEANAKLLNRSTDLLTELFPGLTFESGKVSVRNLSQGSPLKELFALSVVLVYQKKLEEEVPALIEQLTGVQVSDDYDSLVTVFVMLIAIYGIGRAYEALFPGRASQPIADTQETLLQKASKITGVTVERISGALSVLFTGRQHRATVLASQKMFAPTRGQAQAAIKGDGAVLVPPDAVAMAQSAAGFPYEGPDDEEKPKKDLQFHRNVKIILHAMDRDRKKSGWAGHVPGLFDGRVPMDLEKSQNPDALFGKSEVTGDILVTMEEDEDGEMQPKEFLLVQSYLE